MENYIKVKKISSIKLTFIFLFFFYLYFQSNAFDKNLEKHCDFNHTKKNFTNRLFELRKEKKYSALGPKRIKHITKCFTYAVKGNTERESLKNNLRAIPFHVTGDHSKCGDLCG